MRRQRRVALGALATVIAMAASACGSSTGSNSGPAVVENAALTGIVNPQSGEGGTLTYVTPQDWDSVDTGNTYYAFTWDFDRLYARTMLSYKQLPGAAGLQMEGDLATGLGQHNANNTVWTYHIVPNAKFADGTTITTQDIAYAIERSNYTSVLTQGPTYFHNLLQNKNNYQGPYVDPKGTVSGISVPNPTTITFTLNQPFADFNYLMTLMDTAPVEQSKDTGATYYEHYVATGQYEIQSYTKGKQMVLVPNPNFVAASDPNGLHKVHASKIVVDVSVAPTTVDQDLLHGDAQIDLSGLGVQDATQGTILGNPNLLKHSDNPLSGFEDYLAINTTIAPFNNLDCRQAVEYVVNKTEVQSEFGGSVGGGQIASTILPTNNSGYKAANVYATPGSDGNLTKAKSLLTSCEQQLTAAGTWSNADLSFQLSTWQDYPKMVAAANSIQANLDSLGFNVTIDNKPSNVFFANYAGNPQWATQNRVALAETSWGADFPTGYGYMENILTSNGISSTGGSTNLCYWDSPTFDGLMSKALATSDSTQRNAYYAQADQYAMSQAVIVPLLYQSVLLYRPPTATNVTFSQAYGMYDYSIIGATTGS